MTVDHVTRGLLLAMAIGLVPIAMAYGTAPQAGLPWLYRIDASGVPTRHVFRAIMGLYLALIVFWLVGGLRSALRRPALWSLFVFTFGLASGRVLSLAIDGWPGVLLFGYTLAEIALAALAGGLLAQPPDQREAG